MIKPDQNVTETTIKECIEKYGLPINVVFSIDASNSMNSSDPDNLRLKAANAFIDKLKPDRDMAGIVSWSEEVKFLEGLSSNFSSLKELINQTELSGGTNLNNGLRTAISMLDNRTSNKHVNNIIIFLSDGSGNYTESGKSFSPADDAANKGYRVFSIGLKSSASSLKDMALATGGEYYSAPTAENLAKVFEDIFGDIYGLSSASNQTNVSVNITGFGILSEVQILPMDVVFAIDSSTSMKFSDPDNTRLKAAEFFADTLKPVKDQLGIVSWDDNTDFVVPLTRNVDKIISNISTIDSKGRTDITKALESALAILNANLRTGTSSKAIILISDGRSEYPESDKLDDLVTQAKAKGYRIFTIGLNAEAGSDEERVLKYIADNSGGQYYLSPTGQNIQAIYHNISRLVNGSSAPSNIDVVDVVNAPMILNESNITIKPTNIQKIENGQTIIVWENVAKYIGNHDDFLTNNETFNVRYSSILNALRKENTSFPLGLPAASFVTYSEPAGTTNVSKVPVNYVNFVPRICQKPQDFRSVFGALIVPGSNNGTIGSYKLHDSNLYSPSEKIEFYMEYVGISKLKSQQDNNTTKYQVNTTNLFTIKDDKGKIIDTQQNLSQVQVLDPNASSFHVFNYQPEPPLVEGKYILDFTIKDNLNSQSLEATRPIKVSNKTEEINQTDTTQVAKDIDLIDKTQEINDTAVTDSVGVSEPSSDKSTTKENKSSITSKDNHVPVALDQTVALKEGESIRIMLQATDVDNDNLTYSIVSKPSQGTLDETSLQEGIVIYSATPGFVGYDTFGFKVNDGIIDSANIGTISVEVE